MSFLFTFRLPSLPFANPFATGSTTSNEDSEGSSPAVARLQHRNPSLRFGGSTGSGRNTHYSSGPHPFVGNNEGGCGNINPRKRTREASFGDNKSTFASSQNVSHYYDNDPTRGSTGRGRDLWVEYDSQIEGGTDGRAGKKRKMGVAETILSTAVSVAIVSTAVGYTAYRLWRDGGVTLSGDTSAQQHDEIAGKGMSNFEDEQEGRRSLTMAGVASPPPPYDATTYEDSWAGYNAQSLRGEASTPASTGIRNSSYKNEPGSSRHPSKLDSPTKRSPNKTFPSRNSAYGSLRTLGSGGRQGGRGQVVRAQRAYYEHGTKKGKPGMDRDEQITSPKSEAWRLEERDSGARSRNEERKWKHKKQATDGDEYREEGSSRLDEQMDWMSERLRGLIAEGKRALGKEIVLAEGVAEEDASEKDGFGRLDEEDEGWIDEGVYCTTRTEASSSDVYERVH